MLYTLVALVARSYKQYVFVSCTVAVVVISSFTYKQREYLAQTKERHLPLVHRSTWHQARTRTCCILTSVSYSLEGSTPDKTPWSCSCIVCYNMCQTEEENTLNQVTSKESLILVSIDNCEHWKNAAGTIEGILVIDFLLLYSQLCVWHALAVQKGPIRGCITSEKHTSAPRWAKH